MRAGCHPQTGLGGCHGILQKLLALCPFCRKGDLGLEGGRGLFQDSLLGREGTQGPERGPARGGQVDMEPGEPSFAQQGRRGEQLTLCTVLRPHHPVPPVREGGPPGRGDPGPPPPQVSSDQRLEAAKCLMGSVATVNLVTSSLQRGPGGGNQLSDLKQVNTARHCSSCNRQPCYS